jgi:hypothetical protein
MEEEMTRHNQIHYVEFQATDLDLVRTFYNRIFGWSFQDYGPDYTSFQDGRIAGGFVRTLAPAAANPLIVIYVDDLLATRKLVAENGGTISREIFSFPGGSRFHFTDPCGNELAAWHQD